MEEYRKEILDKSTEVIQQLYDLALFFEDPTLMKIYLQTQVIHRLFADNEEIDINKLELFHLQFTTTLIDLLSKIKQKNERIVGMYTHEIELNNDVIEKMKQLIQKEGGFGSESQKQAQRMAKSLYNLYVVIYKDLDSYPFTEDISSFNINYYKDYFFEADPQLLQSLTTYNKKDVYHNRFATIEKELLLALGKTSFNIKFYVGVRFDSIRMEIYKIQTSDVYFLYLPSKNLFLKCDINQFPYEEWEAAMTKKEQTIRNLKRKNQRLETDIKNIHKYISPEISELLEDDYKALTDMDFLSSLENIDTQANILKKMLETKML
jgi:hypothetical protein